MKIAVTGTDVVDDTVVAFLVSDDATADWDSFNNTTDSLEAASIVLGTPTAADLSADLVAILGSADTNGTDIGTLTATVGTAGDGLTAIPGLQVLTGTADSGSITTMVDAALTEADTDYWSKNTAVVWTDGTIIGQTACITSFTPGTDTITFTPPTTQAVGTNTYVFFTAPGCDPFR